MILWMYGIEFSWLLCLKLYIQNKVLLEPCTVVQMYFFFLHFWKYSTLLAGKLVSESGAKVLENL